MMVILSLPRVIPILGEPFEEAIVFEVLLADSERFYDERTLSAYLELGNRQSFLDEVLAKL